MPIIYLDTPTDAQRRVVFVSVADGTVTLAAGTRITSTDMLGGTWSLRAILNGLIDATAITNPTEIDSTSRKGAWFFAIPAAFYSSASGARVGDKLIVYIDNTGGTESMIGREIEIEVVQDPRTARSQSKSLRHNPRWKKAQATAALRRILLEVVDTHGDPVDSRIQFDGTNELLVDPSSGAQAAAGGALANVTRPLTFSDITFTTTHASELVNAAAHGLKTGDGPLYVENTGGGLPTGYTVLTPYYWIWRSTGTGQLASSLPNALAHTAVTISSDGTGTHKIVDIPGTTRRLVDGSLVYTASAAEIDIDGAYFGVTVQKDATTGTATGVTSAAGTSTLAGTGFLPRHVGRQITVAGFAGAGNNGVFKITAVALAGTSCTYLNPSGVTETLGVTWTLDDAVPAVGGTAELYELEIEMDSGMGGKPWSDIHRGNTAVIAGRAEGFGAGLINWICPFSGKTRWTHTIVPDGRSVATEGDLTP